MLIHKIPSLLQKIDFGEPRKRRASKVNLTTPKAQPPYIPSRKTSGNDEFFLNETGFKTEKDGSDHVDDPRKIPSLR